MNTTTIVSIENFQDSVSAPGVELSGSIDCQLSNGRILRAQWGEPYSDGRGDPCVSLDGSECIEIFPVNPKYPNNGAPKGATPSSLWPECLEYPALASPEERAAMEQAIDEARGQ